MKRRRWGKHSLITKILKEEKKKHKCQRQNKELRGKD